MALIRYTPSATGRGRPLMMLFSEGQMSDYEGAARKLYALPRAKALLGDWLR